MNHETSNETSNGMNNEPRKETNNAGERQTSPRSGAIHVTILDRDSGFVLRDAAVSLHKYEPPSSDNKLELGRHLATAYTDHQGLVVFTGVAEGKYWVVFKHLPRKIYGCSELPNAQIADLHCGSKACIEFDLKLQFRSNVVVVNGECQIQPCQPIRTGEPARLVLEYNGSDQLPVQTPSGMSRISNMPTTFAVLPQISGQQSWATNIEFPLMANMAAASSISSDPALMRINGTFPVSDPTATPISGNIGVALARTGTTPTADLSLWVVIRNSADALSFDNYQAYMDFLIFKNPNNTGVKNFEKDRFPGKEQLYQKLQRDRSLPFSDSESYRVLKAATEAFVMVNCGVFTKPQAFDQVLDEAYLSRRDIPAPNNNLIDVFNDDYLESVNGSSQDRTLPYLAIVQRKLPDVPITSFQDLRNPEVYVNLVQNRLQNPCMLELIWSYWHEEGMLVQTMNAITRRFQNVRTPAGNDPLANMEIDPLRPLNNVIWGYTQDEQHRLTVVRRNYEYDHHYGLHLEGNAVKNFRPADTRSKFLEAFHHLLRICTVFYRQDDNTTVKADAFPVLNALKEVHLILSQGAHNQFGDLPSTARVEMLMQQWILARPEFREFLPTRAMVAYPEPWMDRVDAMKKLQNWTDTSVLHFRSLGMFGEQILLSIRFGAWSDVYEPTQAFNWTRFWRPQIQGYIHAYRAATGVDLTNEAVDIQVDATLPSVLLQKRLNAQQRNATA